MKVKIMSFKPKTIAKLALAVALSLTGCGPDLSINSVTIYTDQDANQNSAIAVDLVVLYDDNLVKGLGQMSASQYFSTTSQLLLDNPTLLDIWHWELVPGQVVQVFSPETATAANGAYVFANYLTPGDHRLKVAPSGIIAILLQKNDLLNLSPENLAAVHPGTTMSDLVKTISQGDILNSISQAEGIKSPILKQSAPIVTNILKTPPALQKNAPGALSSFGSRSQGNARPSALKQLTPPKAHPTKILPALRKNTPGPKVKNG
ncbi:MAG: hypothetical protein K2X28_04580 [Alphaproteobacteria bacterium]|nr:hypothetical protein [Alphaproteobacteria bacterium]